MERTRSGSMSDHGSRPGSDCATRCVPSVVANSPTSVTWFFCVHSNAAHAPKQCSSGASALIQSAQARAAVFKRSTTCVHARYPVGVGVGAAQGEDVVDEVLVGVGRRAYGE